MDMKNPSNERTRPAQDARIVPVAPLRFTHAELDALARQLETLGDPWPAIATRASKEWTFDRRVTLKDLWFLCDRYVPSVSRHPSSWRPEAKDPSNDWWPAHELGHLLTAVPQGIGALMFGLNNNRFDDHELRCRELAAMSISYRLLVAARRADLADEELLDTDMDTIMYEDRGRVAEILAAHQCLQLPRMRLALERKIMKVVARSRSADVALLTIASPALSAIEKVLAHAYEVE